jgi:hypothetical protein
MLDRRSAFGSAGIFGALLASKRYSSCHGIISPSRLTKMAASMNRGITSTAALRFGPLHYSIFSSGGFG